eukprot:3709756-Amphidinium_carterae.2
MEDGLLSAVLILSLRIMALAEGWVDRSHCCGLRGRESRLTAHSPHDMITRIVKSSLVDQAKPSGM